MEKADPQIQLLALSCLYLWNDPYLTNYKDNISRLVDERTFRDELSLFSVSPDGPISFEHRLNTCLICYFAHFDASCIIFRRDFIPVLLKILYSKLITRQKKGACGSGGTKV